MGVPALAQLLTLSAGANSLPNLPAGQTTPLTGVDFAALLAERLPADTAIPAEDQAARDPLELTSPAPESIGSWLLPPGLMPQASAPGRADPAPIGARTQSAAEGAEWKTIKSQASNTLEDQLASARLLRQTTTPSRPDESGEFDEPNIRPTASQLLAFPPLSNIVSETSANPRSPGDGELPETPEHDPALFTDLPWAAAPGNTLVNSIRTDTNEASLTPKTQQEQPLPITRAIEQPRILPEHGKVINETNTTQPAFSKTNDQSTETAGQPIAVQPRAIAPTAEQLMASMPPNKKAASETNSRTPKAPQTDDQPIADQPTATAIAPTAEQLMTSALANEKTASQTSYRAPKAPQTDEQPSADQPTATAIAPTAERLMVPALANKKTVSETGPRSPNSIETIDRPLVEQTRNKAPATPQSQASAPNIPFAPRSRMEQPESASPDEHFRELQARDLAPVSNLPEVSKSNADIANQASIERLKSAENDNKLANDSARLPKPIAPPFWISAANKQTAGEASTSPVKSSEGDQQTVAGQPLYSAPTAERSYIVPPSAPALNYSATETPASEYLQTAAESVGAMHNPVSEKEGPEQLPVTLGKTSTPSMQTAASPSENAIRPPNGVLANTANIAGEPVQSNENGTSFAAMLTTQTKANDAPPPTQLAINTPLHDQQWSQNLGDKVVWLAKADQQSAQIHINPPQLGPVQITLNLTGDQASIAFSSPHGEVRQAIQDAMPQLREMLSSAGINLGQTNVGSQQPQGGRDLAWQFANENRSAGENAILPAENQAAPSTSGLMIQRGRGLVDLFA